MEIIEVPDIMIAKNGVWRSLRGGAVAKDGFKTFDAGSGVYKDGNLYVLDSPDYTLIGGVKWAKTNLIADPNDETGMTSVFAPTPDSYGDLYQWGRKKAWQYEGDATGLDITPEPGTEYQTPWPAVNDPSPVGWRIPTTAELITLFNMNHTWVSVGESGNTVAGMFFGINSATATMSDMRGCVFLPAAGAINGNDTHISLYRGEQGIYRNNIKSNPVGLFNKSGYAEGDYYYNSAKDVYFFSIRCVKI
jgi:uncharacterized protein (TIGR02145 family)